MCVCVCGEGSIFITVSWRSNALEKTQKSQLKSFDWAAISLIFMMCSRTPLVPVSFLDDNYFIDGQKSFN